MSLHVELSGHGKPLALLHGWGMHGGIWSEVAAQLAQDWEVHSVDLPGHGKSLAQAEFTLDAVVDQLSAQLRVPLNVLGWSLGGIIAQHWAARKPEQVERMVLVASTPCFANRVDWSCGMPPETLQMFSAELERDYAATLRRFLALQVRGSEGERALLAELRERLFSRGEPDLAALRGGLQILRDADLRAKLVQIRQPTLVVAGARDKITPPQASHYLAQMLPNARMVEIEGAAHAPFLSHPQIVIEQLKSFLNE
jgi:pimeloyl-[acyl-carrier protein] methyl ester esterase